MSNLIGQSLGRYHILEQLGEGGMASVYKAFDTRLEREVAVKVILPQQQHTEMFLKRFEREARTLAKLSHPNIVKILDYGDQDGQPYLVMEYIPGGMLKTRMGQPMDFREADRLLLPVARALEQAHNQNIIHRDVKPANILLTHSGDPMLTDFGIAKIVEAEATTMDLTGTGTGIGTPQYMAPEQGLGEPVDARADVYALGIVLYELICGRTPYQADTPMAILLKKATEPLPSPRNFVPDLPDEVVHILIKALAKDPAYRFENMGAFASALAKLLEPPVTTSDRVVETIPGNSVGEPKQSVALPAPQVHPQRFVLAGVIALIFLFCVAAGGVGIVLFANRTSATRTAVVSQKAEETPVFSTSPTLETAAPVWELPTQGETVEVSSALTEPPTRRPGNGKWIAFDSKKDGNANIYLVDMQGNHLTQLTSGTAHDLYPSWSPDGQQIVYQTNEGGDQELAIVDIATKKIRKLTSNTCDDWAPVWSPDGEWIAFYSNCDGERQVYRMRSNGNDRRQLTFGAGRYSWFPSWSPDGRKITFTSNRSGSYAIYVMDADGSNQRQLAPGCISYFSPDGTQILYGVYCTDTGELMLMDADGSNQHPLTDGCECKNATWAPDGTAIIFEKSRTTKDGPFAIFIMYLDRPDESNWVMVTDYKINGRSPVWQP